MEIERKFIPDELPDLSGLAYHDMQQGYLCMEPVVRIRKEDQKFYMTYKSKGLMTREEYNLPLTKEAFYHLKQKVDGRVIEKRRYLIPIEDGLTVELDLFGGDLKPLVLAEVEFPTEEQANAFVPPAWLGRDVTMDHRYHNSVMSDPDYELPL